MRKRGIAVLTGLMLFSVNIGGCGKGGESAVEEPRWETVNGAEASADGESGKGGTESSTGRLAAVEGLIEEQSFEVELDGWGKVFFASIAPAKDGGRPRFLLMKNGETVYTFPETGGSSEGKFVEVEAVAFQDYNQDGKKDAVVLVSYSNGADKWSEPVIFLQENSDNMFYMDYPEAESYRVKAETEAGPAFYRDTFLEKYLREQELTDSISALSGSWADYVGYMDGLYYGMFSEERQIQVFAENRELWSAGMDYANEIHRFTLANLGYDGKLTLIAANQGGTGHYTYSEFYQVDEKGGLRRLETSFEEGDSQPDIIEDKMTVYSSFSNSGNLNYFIVYDGLKESPDSYVYRVSSLSVSDNYVLETPLAIQRVVYTGEDYSAQITGEDCSGNPLTEEEYADFADNYYGKIGLTKKTAAFKWIDVSSLEGKSTEEVGEALREAYAGFSLE
ncbi:MAG: hypothetical protein NC400_04825 [Clostridium sp.]|nr:hypothetical protein [Clostridium sp.]